MDGLLKVGGRLILPCLQNIKQGIEDNKMLIAKHYTISYLSNPGDNPLYVATDMVESVLLQCPDAVTNETQLPPLLLGGNSYPFVELTVKAATSQF